MWRREPPGRSSAARRAAEVVLSCEARTSGVVPALEGRGGAAKVRPKSRLREPFVVEQDGLREIGREDWVVEVAVGRERGRGGQRALAGRGGGWLRAASVWWSRMVVTEWRSRPNTTGIAGTVSASKH